MYLVEGILVIILIFLLYIYKISVRKMEYWKHKGVPFVKPLPFIGNLSKLLFFKLSQGELYKEVYRKYLNEKYIGFYEFTSPVLLVNDPELIEKILVKDFKYFVNRNIPVNEESDIEAGLFSLRSSEWRGVRYRLTPAFSSGKLKLMYQNMLDCANNLEDTLSKMEGTDVDMKEISTQFSLDVIANCVFGIDISQDKGSQSEFRRMGEKIFDLNVMRYLAFLLLQSCPKLAKRLGITFFGSDVNKYFSRIIKDTFDHRTRTNFNRNDFIQLLLQLKKEGKIEVQSKTDPDDSYLELDYNPTSEEVEMTNKILISQAFVFLTAGFDGLSSTSLFCLYELAKHPAYQEEVRRELQTQIKENNGLTYNALKNTSFLDKCVNETLRLYPLNQFLFRECGKDYKLDETVTLEEGTKVVIPIFGLHLDPRYYPEPEKFNPERWNSTISHTVTNFTYLPFGAGPRMCIGMRFALVEMKLGLATILTKYRISLSSMTPSTIQLKTMSLVTNPKQTIYIHLKKL